MVLSYHISSGRHGNVSKMSKVTNSNIIELYFRGQWFVRFGAYICSIFNRVAYAYVDIVSTAVLNNIHMAIPVGAIMNKSLKQGIATPELVKSKIMLNSINI